MALFSKLFNKKMYSDTDVVSPVKGRMPTKKGAKE